MRPDFRKPKPASIKRNMIYEVVKLDRSSCSPDDSCRRFLRSLSSCTTLRPKAVTRKVDIRLPGKGNSNSHGARSAHLIITTIKWFRTSRLSKLSLAGLDRSSCSPEDSCRRFLRSLSSCTTLRPNAVTPASNTSCTEGRCKAT